MGQSYEAHSLIIRHLAVLEKAPVIVEEVEKKVFAILDSIVETWVNDQSEWDGEYDYVNSTTFKPKSWRKNEDKIDAFAWYGFNVESGEGYQYGLSAILNIFPDKFGIWFQVDPSSVTGIVGKGSRPAPVWKNYLAEQFLASGLKEQGFQFEGGDILLPIKIDAGILSENYPDSIELALKPIAVALDTIKKAHTEIDKLLNDALKHFQTTETETNLTLSIT